MNMHASGFLSGRSTIIYALLRWSTPYYVSIVLSYVHTKLESIWPLLADIVVERSEPCWLQ
jgi:hypothetical protein